MSKFWAIPIRDNGMEKLGTDGVLIGRYASIGNFVRFMMLKHGRPGITYNIYACERISTRGAKPVLSYKVH